MPSLNAAENPLIAPLANLPSPHDCLGDYLSEYAATRGGACACVDGTQRMSYRELAEAVARQAALLADLGVARGDCVATLVPPSIDFFVSFLSTTSLGAVWLGLNPKHTRAELQYVLTDAAPKVLLARSRIAGRDYLGDLLALETPSTRLLLLDGRRDGAEFPAIAELLARTGSTVPTPIAPLARSDDPALLVYTSGSTGAPKGALLSHRALIRAALVRAHTWRVVPMRSLNNAPVSHVGGAGDIACTTLVAGGCQIFQEKFDAARTLSLIESERVSYWYQAPTMFQLCLDHPQARTTDWSHLQAAIWSGGRPTQDLVKRLAAVATHLAVDYSMTESVGAITLTPLTRSTQALQDSVGWPDPGRGIRIVDPQTLGDVAAGSPGEMQLRDAWLFSGYRNRVADPTTHTDDGWFRTGDIVIREAGGSLRIAGRLKEMFKSGGYNVYPKEVEQVIERHASVAAAAVIPIADALYGEVGVAFIATKDATLTSADLTAHCRSTLAGYKIPKRFVISADLPLLPIGKIDRVALRAQAQSLESLKEST